MAEFAHPMMTHRNGDKCVWIKGTGWFVPYDVGGEGEVCEHPEHAEIAGVAVVEAVEAQCKRIAYDVALAREVMRSVGDLGGKVLRSPDPDMQGLGHDICEKSLRAWRVVDVAFKRSQSILDALSAEKKKEQP